MSCVLLLSSFEAGTKQSDVSKLSDVESSVETSCRYESDRSVFL